MAPQIMGKRGRREGERSQAEMTVVGETDSNADGRARQEIIAKLRTGEDVDLERERADASEPEAVRVVSRLGEIGRLSRADAATIAPYRSRALAGPSLPSRTTSWSVTLRSVRAPLASSSTVTIEVVMRAFSLTIVIEKQMRRPSTMSS
jgi:hypothetical protein